MHAKMLADEFGTDEKRRAILGLAAAGGTSFYIVAALVATMTMI